MTRILPIGNGDMLLNFDMDYNLRDIYYPNTGGENHGSLSRFGIYIDDKFTWLSEPCWQKHLDYEPSTLVTAVEAENPDLELRILAQDMVDVGRPIYLKKVVFQNLSHEPREVRAFFHWDLNISGYHTGNAIYYAPALRSLIQYRGRRYFLVNAACAEEVGLHDFATGIKGRNGAKGTWCDAEDGKLSRNAASHGGVDGVAGLRLEVPARGEAATYWWIVAGQNYREVSELNQSIITRTPEFFLERTRTYWRTWVNRSHACFGDLDEQLLDLYKRSLLVLRTHTDNRGGILAANDSDVTAYNDDNYSYIWPRDGALAAIALSNAGFNAQPQKFFSFCADALAEEGFLFHRYNPDGSLGSSWHTWTDGNGGHLLPIQEDETALVLVALWHHYREFQDIDLVHSLYSTLVKPAASFMVSYREPHTGLPEASYDLWEERRGISAYTVSAVWAGLQSAAGLAQSVGDCSLATTYKNAAEEIKVAALNYLYSPKLRRFVRMIKVDSQGHIEIDPILDSSLSGLFYFDMVHAGDPRIIQTMQAMEKHLWCPECGGIARYEGDPYLRVCYHPGGPTGNPWIVCTLWLAQWYIAVAESLSQLEKARQLLEWVRMRTLPGGIMPEQINPSNSGPISASPLTWSHATYVLAVQEYGAKYKLLSNGHSAHQKPYLLQELSHV